MKNLKNGFVLLPLLCLLFLYACTDERYEVSSAPVVEQIDHDAQVAAQNENDEFDQLILENIDAVDNSVKVHLSVEEFEQALELTLGKSEKNLARYFADAKVRKIFRQQLGEILSNQGTASFGANFFCEETFFAEAFSIPGGYNSASSNSFAYASSNGNTNLWASAFSCDTFDELYIQESDCANAYPNCGSCLVRALYYSGGGQTALFGVFPCN